MQLIRAIPRSASRIRQAISPIVSVEICDYANTSALRRPLRPTAPDYSASCNARRPNRGIMPGSSTAIAWWVMFVPPDRSLADTDSVVLSATLAQSEHITRVRQITSNPSPESRISDRRSWHVRHRRAVQSEVSGQLAGPGALLDPVGPSTPPPAIVVRLAAPAVGRGVNQRLFPCKREPWRGMLRRQRRNGAQETSKSFEGRYWALNLL